MATLKIPADPKIADIFGTTNIPEYVSINGTNGPVSGYAFDAATMEQIFVRVPAWDYLSGNVTLYLRWASRAGSTTGAVIWGGQLAALTPGDAQSVLTDSFATAATTTTTVNGTASGPTETQVVITALDSLADGDDLCVRIYRDAAAGGDTMSGDAVLMEISIGYAANSGGGSGDVTGPGSATDNAICRFDLATGKVVQNSAATVDDSGNITAPRFIGPATGLRETGGPTDLSMGGVADGDLVERSGSNLSGRYIGVCERSTDFTINNTALIDVTNMQFVLPRAGTYHFSFALATTKDSTGSILGWGVNYSGTTTRVMVNGVFWQSGTSGNEAATGSINTAILETTFTAYTRQSKTINGSITVSTSGTLILRAQRSSTSSVQLLAGSSGLCVEQ